MKRWLKRLLWGALLVGAAQGEQLTVVFTPQDRQAKARGNLIVLACAGEFSSVSRAGLIQAYTGKMLSRKVDLAEITDAMSCWLASPPPSLREALIAWAAERDIQFD